jgi:hypothetical protein
MQQVANTRGTGKDRGSALELHQQQQTGGQREVTVQTSAGPRRQDVGNIPKRSQTEMAIEAKNYKRWITVNKTPVEQVVPLTPFIRSEIERDAAWVADGRKLNPPVHRVVQWVFGGAKPRADLAALLTSKGLPYVTNG